MQIREPVVAGQFYPASSTTCRDDLTKMLSGVNTQRPPPDGFMGGLVPHAGWMCSGIVAAQVFANLAVAGTPKVVILFGAVHRSRGRKAAMFGSGRWATPVGSVEIDTRLSERILGQTNLILDDPYAHENEHSLEVQMPFVAHLFPGAAVVPIMVPPISSAHQVGEAVGRTLRAYQYNALIVGTTDLTHYGPNYRFESHGTGAQGLGWAKEDNDRRFIDLVCAMKSAEVVGEAAKNRNACGAGAVAATLSAVTTLGATQATLLTHTTSAEVLSSDRPDEATDSVGYAGFLFS
ncbi:MAG: AmmeMemoRadiSam system protein B [Planctomycetes bacterium]|nr:AmmeMemoRadiSam system protein B [Planctomycetota bacterium]